MPPPAWRPFQLAFILLTLSGLADETDADRERVDLLFFPTGGGKTEAYLGLAAFTMVLRRLRHGMPSGCGVSVPMRYTLRLLTLDQLGRATALICALELLRTVDAARLGDWPFEIGLWVGQAATPNRMGCRGDKQPGSDFTACTKTMRYQRDDRRNPAPIPTEECPWCGEPFTKHSFRLAPNATAPKNLLVTCTNPDCDFTRDRPLPVVGVDEPIYRRLPAFVIATVDKFAALPWTGHTGCLFGLVDRTDGDGFYGPCDPGKGGPLGQPSLPPLDLVIQDELHLISGPLGTIAGLYEAALDELATRDRDGQRIRPKVIASTAAVRRADTQIRGLADRAVSARSRCRCQPARRAGSQPCLAPQRCRRPAAPRPGAAPLPQPGRVGRQSCSAAANSSPASTPGPESGSTHPSFRGSATTCSTPSAICC